MDWRDTNSGMDSPLPSLPPSEKLPKTHISHLMSQVRRTVEIKPSRLAPDYKNYRDTDSSFDSPILVASNKIFHREIENDYHYLVDDADDIFPNDNLNDSLVDAVERMNIKSKHIGHMNDCALERMEGELIKDFQPDERDYSNQTDVNMKKKTASRRESDDLINLDNTKDWYKEEDIDPDWLTRRPSIAEGLEVQQSLVSKLESLSPRNPTSNISITKQTILDKLDSRLVNVAAANITTANKSGLSESPNIAIADISVVNVYSTNCITVDKSLRTEYPNITSVDESSVTASPCSTTTDRSGVSVSPTYITTPDIVERALSLTSFATLDGSRPSVSLPAVNPIAVNATSPTAITSSISSAEVTHTSATIAQTVSSSAVTSTSPTTINTILSPVPFTPNASPAAVTPTLSSAAATINEAYESQITGDHTVITAQTPAINPVTEESVNTIFSSLSNYVKLNGNDNTNNPENIVESHNESPSFSLTLSRSPDSLFSPCRGEVPTAKLVNVETTFDGYDDSISGEVNNTLSKSKITTSGILPQRASQVYTSKLSKPMPWPMPSLVMKNRQSSTSVLTSSVDISGSGDCFQKPHTLPQPSKLSSKLPLPFKQDSRLPQPKSNSKLPLLTKSREH